jgi:hypothetical protein
MDGDGDAVHDNDAHAAATMTAPDEDVSNNSNSISWRARRQSTVPAAVVAACLAALVAAVAVGSSGALLRYQRGVVRLSWEPIIEQRDGCELTRTPMALGPDVCAAKVAVEFC